MLSTLLLTCLLPACSSHLTEQLLPRDIWLWLGGEADLPANCHSTDGATSEHSVPFIKYGLCREVESNCEYIPYGKLDAEGRLEGVSELVIHWTEGDSEDITDEDGDAGDEADESICYSVTVPLSIRAVRGYFTKGVPQGLVTIEHRNGEETVGSSVDGVLHGVTVTKSREGRVLYVGRHRAGRPDGWGWAFSPSEDSGHGVMGFRSDGGEVIWDEVAYLDMEQKKTFVGSYSEQLGRLSVYSTLDMAVGVKDCLPDISIPACSGDTVNSRIELPFLVKIVSNRVRVALKHLVVYNRVPKTGSQSLLYLRRDLSEDTASFRVHFPPTRSFLETASNWSIKLLNVD